MNTRNVAITVDHVPHLYSAIAVRILFIGGQYRTFGLSESLGRRGEDAPGHANSIRRDAPNLFPLGGQNPPAPKRGGNSSFGLPQRQNRRGGGAFSTFLVLCPP